jgi:hypothetical protein
VVLTVERRGELVMRKSYRCNFPSHMSLHLLIEWAKRDLDHRSFQVECKQARVRGSRFSGGWKVSLWSTRSRKRGEFRIWHVGPGIDRAVDNALSWAEKRGWP